MFNDIVIDVKDSDSSSSESEYDYSCNSEESAVGDVERESLQKKTSSAAVGASGGNASVAATCGSPPFEPESQEHPVFYVLAAPESQEHPLPPPTIVPPESESPPFEEESQEGQLLNLRGACREHVRNGLPPPSVPAGSFGGIGLAHGPDDEEKKQRTRTTGPDDEGKEKITRKRRRFRASSPCRQEIVDPRPKKKAPPRTPAVAGESAVVGKSAAGGEPAGPGESAVGGESAVAGEATTRRAKGDIGAFLTDDEKREFVGQQVFNDSSALWKALRCELAVRGSSRGKGRMVDEQIFLLFSVNEGGGLQESLTRNFHAWCNGMKDYMLKWPEEWSELLANVSRRPLAPGQAAGPSMLGYIKGLFTKYAWQYRMASPISSAMIDEWTKSQAIPDRELLMFSRAGNSTSTKTT